MTSRSVNPLGSIGRRFRSTAHRPSGFTLLEVIITISISTIILLVVINILAVFLRDNRIRRAQLDVTDRANQIVRYMTGLVRETQSSPTGAYPIINATNTSLSFYSTVGSGATIQQVRIFLTGTTLQQGIIQPTGTPATYPPGNEVVTTLLTGVRNGGQALFSYYDSAYTGSQAALNPITVSSIRLIKATVIYDQNTQELPPATTIQLQAQLRNLKDNY